MNYLKKNRNIIIISMSLLLSICFVPFFSFSQASATSIPNIITRSMWGADESKMTWKTDYAKVEKIIIHHTASSTLVPDADGSGEFKSMVNNIYTYYNGKKKWYDDSGEYVGFGDIGYNYLIDPNGNIYEGRFGGNGVVGGHVNGFNTGTVGISILGTYGGNINKTYISNPLNSKITKSIESLVGWVSAGNNIQLNKSSIFNGKKIDGLVGHRDLSPTNCPGDNLYSQLDSIQNNADVIKKKFDKYIYQIGGDRAIYIIANGYKTKFNSISNLPSAYANKTIQPITKSQLDFYKYKDLNIYPDESLLQEFDMAMVYYIENGKKRPMEMTGEEFIKMGYQTSDIIKVFNSDLKLYESGKIIKYAPENKLITDSKGTVYLSQNGKKRKFTSAKLFEYLGYKWDDIKEDQSISFYLEGLDLIYPNQTLIRKENQDKIYYIEDKQRHEITSETLMNILGFDINNVISINDDEFKHFPNGTAMKYPNDTLVKSVESPSIYLIKDAKKKEFTSAVLFETAGYKWKNVIEIEKNEIIQYPNDGKVLYPDGFLIKSEQMPDIYLLESRKRRKITSINLFEKLGYSWDKIITINSDEIKDYPVGENMLYPDGTLIQKNGFPNIFKIENGKRKEFTSLTLFETMNNKWSEVVVLSREEFSNYSSDGFVKYPDGVLLRKIKGDKVYVIKDGDPQAIQSAEEFLAAGYKWSNVIEITEPEMNLYLKPKIIAKLPVTPQIPQEKVGNDKIGETNDVVDSTERDNPNIKIAIYATDNKDVIVSANGNYTVNYYNSDGTLEKTDYKVTNQQTVIKYFTANSFVKFVPENKNVILKLVSYSDLAWDKITNDNEFRGNIEIKYSDQSEKLWIINDLLLEDYVNGVAESFNDSPEEYLKAFGTIARTYAIYYIKKGGKHMNEPFILKNSRNGNGNDQVYKGYNFEMRAAKIVAANKLTKGFVINYNNKPIVAAYSSDSGGVTKNACDVLSKTYCSNDFLYLHGGIKDPQDTKHSPEKISISHGAGMSAVGAYQMSLDGTTWQEIIKYYYPGTEIVK
ncbi:N-acetylmuramoyl-L-alanine amidase [Patescibacteria group bacterium]|nr:N-acetylmuramoyl-L-alanine amidase [Patescibacteria group bacterium]